MIDDNHLNYFLEASEEFREAAAKEMARELAAKFAAIGPGKFPEIKTEWTRMTPENEARVAELLALETAKKELRKVAMQLHNEARAVLQNVFLCRADVVDALNHLNSARMALEAVFLSSPVTNALNIPYK